MARPNQTEEQKRQPTGVQKVMRVLAPVAVVGGAMAFRHMTRPRVPTAALDPTDVTKRRGSMFTEHPKALYPRHVTNNPRSVVWEDRAGYTAPKSRFYSDTPHAAPQPPADVGTGMAKAKSGGGGGGGSTPEPPSKPKEPSIPLGPDGEPTTKGTRRVFTKSEIDHAAAVQEQKSKTALTPDELAKQREIINSGDIERQRLANEAAERAAAQAAAAAGTNKPSTGTGTTKPAPEVRDVTKPGIKKAAQNARRNNRQARAGGEAPEQREKKKAAANAAGNERDQKKSNKAKVPKPTAKPEAKVPVRVRVQASAQPPAKESIVERYTRESREMASGKSKKTKKNKVEQHVQVRAHAKLNPILFQLGNEDFNNMMGASERAMTAYRKGRRMVPWLRRGSQVINDTSDVASGRKPDDPFWKKQWAKSAAIGAVLAAPFLASRKINAWHQQDKRFPNSVPAISPKLGGVKESILGGARRLDDTLQRKLKLRFRPFTDDSGPMLSSKIRNPILLQAIQRVVQFETKEQKTQKRRDAMKAALIGAGVMAAAGPGIAALRRTSRLSKQVPEAVAAARAASEQVAAAAQSSKAVADSILASRNSTFLRRRLGFRARLPRLIQFAYADALDRGWDLRDARGRSARVYAPGSKRRERREKEWGEKVDNIRAVRNAAIVAALAGVGGTMYYRRRYRGLQKQTTPPVKVEVAQGNASKLTLKPRAPAPTPSAPEIPPGPGDVIPFPERKLMSAKVRRILFGAKSFVTRAGQRVTIGDVEGPGVSDGLVETYQQMGKKGKSRVRRVAAAAALPALGYTVGRAVKRPTLGTGVGAFLGGAVL